uniref:Uncharacterized protein n=1 Tax=Anopheles atroparvus TaxID=41427 RepID=A0AAG5CYM8_ANOAO
MRLVGFTLGPNSCAGHTSILLRPPVSVLNSTVRSILPWFFCQTLPPGREFPESLQAIR